MSDPRGQAPAWDEDDTAQFVLHGQVFVPERERQLQIIVDRVHGVTGAPKTVVEICSGQGLLAKAFLDADSQTRMVCYDGSDAMLAETRKTVGPASERLDTRLFRLEDVSWRAEPQNVDAVVSSLAVHHLEGIAKLDLFRDVFSMLRPGGVFVLADLVEPADAAGREILARQWDEEVVRRSEAILGDRSGYDVFRSLDWNYYRQHGPDPVDRPSTLAEQLDWLREAGFRAVDLHWSLAGHVIVSGCRPND